MNVISYESAEAVTIDGRHWEIYVRNEELLRGLDSDHFIQTSEIRYGSWSTQAGLKRGPIYPSNDFKRMEEMGATVFESLTLLHNRAPFPYKDIYELWLLGANNLPLALIGSAISIQEIELDVPLLWRAGNLCEQTFNPQLNTDVLATENPAKGLTAYINSLSSSPPRAQWFSRESDGSGIGLAGINLDIEEERILKPGCFPQFLLDTAGHDSAYTELVRAYIEWQAPWLLLLHSLSRETRTRFEKLARQHAMVVDIQQRLYPEIIDQASINAARIEAMLRRSNASAKKSDEIVLSTWYLELGELERGK